MSAMKRTTYRRSLGSNLGVTNSGRIRIHTTRLVPRGASLGSADAQQRLTQLQN